MQNKVDKHSTTVDELAFLQGKTKGKREYSLITIRRYVWDPVA